MAKKKKPQGETETDFDNADTLVRDVEVEVEVSDETREFIVGTPKQSSPPALPFALQRRSESEADWLDALPEAAREVLEKAKSPARSWPEGPRVPGAIAKPLAPPPKKKKA